ncbi:MAG: hypothetical protein WCB58_19315 [Acidobacteriaceae bacterium]
MLIYAEGEAEEGNFRPLRSHQQDSTSDTVYAEGLIASILEDSGPGNLKVVIARNEKYGAPHTEDIISTPYYFGTSSSFSANHGDCFPRAGAPIEQSECAYLA